MITEETDNLIPRSKDLAIDPLLSVLSNIVTTADRFSFSITLLVDGCVIYGELISKNEYFSKTTEVLSEVQNGDLMMLLLNPIIEFPESDIMHNHCIHIKDVVIQQSIPARDVRVPVFRMPIGSISGFCIGRSILF